MENKKLKHARMQSSCLFFKWSEQNRFTLQTDVQIMITDFQLTKIINNNTSKSKKIEKLMRIKCKRKKIEARNIIFLNLRLSRNIFVHIGFLLKNRILFSELKISTFKDSFLPKNSPHSRIYFEIAFEKFRIGQAIMDI